MPGGGAPRLTFWWRMFTYDHKEVDSLDVEVSKDGGSTWKLLWRGGYEAPGPPGCGYLQDLGWQKAEVSLRKYKGQGVVLRFSNVTRRDGWYNTWTYLDGIEVILKKVR